MICIMNELIRNYENPFEQKLAHFEFLCILKLISQKLTYCVSFWAQKLTLWARDTISMEALKTKDEQVLLFGLAIQYSTLVLVL